jgi:hypothetical protein
MNRQSKSKEQRTRLVIRVEKYEVDIDFSINSTALYPQNALRGDDEDPVYRFTNQLRIAGISTYPQDRAGESYELTLHGDDAPSNRIAITLKDIQVRDEYQAPKYRTYRGREVPLYQPPKGLGLLDKARGERQWDGMGLHPHPLGKRCAHSAGPADGSLPRCS